jgi:ABC-2 type transport system permease protein
MGWAIGLLVSGLVLRYGLGAENLAWVAIFAVAPVSGIYYPVSVLPDWLRVIADLLPASYVFEGMRALLFEHMFRTDLFVRAVGLNALYLGFGIAVFLGVFRAARRRGLLINVGE